MLCTAIASDLFTIADAKGKTCVKKNTLPCKGLGNTPKLPATMNIAIASPMALLVPRITPAIIPDFAEGDTT